MKKLIAVLLLNSCVTVPEEPKIETPVIVEPEKPAPVVDYPAVGWHPDYSKLVESKASKSMLEISGERMKSFCPRWPELNETQRRKFYSELFFIMAKYESGYNSLSMFHEKKQGIDAATGLIKLSEGLLQISYSDSLSRRYKCKFDAKKDLEQLKKDIVNMKGTRGRDTLDPIKNLECGISIFDWLLQSDQRDFATVMGRYWSVLRPLKDGKPRKSYEGIKKHLESICK